MKLEIRGMLFDMDGILISSLASVERSWIKWGEMRGVDGAEAIKAAHGRRAIETLRLLRPDLDDVAELKLIEDIECADVEDIEVLKGVKHLLEALPIPNWAIVTSATERLARLRLQVAGLKVPAYFITADMVANGKPHPEPYLRGAGLLGFAPQDCLVVEDAPAGVAAGKAAGCKVLATLFSHTREELAAADYIVESLEHLRMRPTSNGVELEFEPVTSLLTR